MTEGIPGHNLFAELLHESASQLVNHPSSKRVGTHGCDFIKVTRRVNPQYLNCNVGAFVLTLPHVGVPATI